MTRKELNLISKAVDRAYTRNASELGAQVSIMDLTAIHRECLVGWLTDPSNDLDVIVRAVITKYRKN